jgi:hypothetical protein
MIRENVIWKWWNRKSGLAVDIEYRYSVSLVN